MKRNPGWQQASDLIRRTPRCLHLGLLGALPVLGYHSDGHEWVCTCGKVYVVTSTPTGKKLLPKPPKPPWSPS